MSSKKITSHKLARELLKHPDREVSISVDISTCDKDSGRRVFTGEYYGINDIYAPDIVLLFDGVLDD